MNVQQQIIEKLTRNLTQALAPTNPSTATDKANQVSYGGSQRRSRAAKTAASSTTRQTQRGRICALGAPRRTLLRVLRNRENIGRPNSASPQQGSTRGTLNPNQRTEHTTLLRSEH